MLRLSDCLSLLGGCTFTVANVLLWLQAETDLLKTVGGLFTVGSVAFIGATLRGAWERRHG